MTTVIVEVKSDVQHSEVKKGMQGVVDGYVRGADDRPYAAVVFEDSGLIELISTHQLKVRKVLRF